MSEMTFLGVQLASSQLLRCSSRQSVVFSRAPGIYHRQGVFYSERARHERSKCRISNQAASFLFQKIFLIHNFLVLEIYNLSIKVFAHNFLQTTTLKIFFQQTFVIHMTFMYNLFQSTCHEIFFSITFDDIQLTWIAFLEKNLSEAFLA